MAYDEGLAAIMRDDLSEQDGMTERKMFGGLCFMIHGNMVCGVTKTGAMYRVGKDQDAAALAIEGTRPMNFTGKVMAGFVEVDDDFLADDARRLALNDMARHFVKSLPPK